jgi:siroheme decarboxylase
MSETSIAQLDDLDRRLLDRVQRAIPLEPRPFVVLGRELGAAEDEVLTRLEALRGEHGVIRQISAIFDTQALGYASSLVAARIEPDRLERAAAVINEHPGVSHNYERSHAYNLWYTLAIGPESRLGLEATVARLHTLSGATATRMLPTLRLFKIGVRLRMSDDGADGRNAPSAEAGTFTQADRAVAALHTLEDGDIAMIRALQQDLPIEPRPFDAWAAAAGCGVDDLLSAARRFEQRRQMRRFAAVLRHRRAGFGSNVMGMWNVPEPRAEAIGQRLARFSAVSHCYLRPAYDDLPYRIYTMVHAHDRDEAEATLAQMSRATDIDDYQALWSLREFKKVRVRYFTPEAAAWEARHA